jgi:hypothetical protein
LSVSCVTTTNCVGVGASPSGPASTTTSNGSSWTAPEGVAP